MTKAMMFGSACAALFLVAGACTCLRADTLTVQFNANSSSITVLDSSLPLDQVGIKDFTNGSADAGFATGGSFTSYAVPWKSGDNLGVSFSGAGANQNWQFKAVVNGTISVVSDQEQATWFYYFTGVGLGTQFSNYALYQGAADFMVLNNGGPDTFEIVGLQLYDGIPLSYFNPVDFNSPAAIAAGTLYSNVGSFVAAPNNPFEYIVPGSKGTYDLMEVTEEQILRGGGYGSPETFGWANNNPAPEPNTLLLMGTGLLGMVTVLRMRFKGALRH